VRGTLADGTLRGGISLNLREPDRSAFNLALDRADAGKLLAPFPELAGAVQGSADLRLRGTFGRVWRGGGDVMLTRGTVMGIEVSEWRVPVRFEWVPGRGRAQIDIDETTAQAGRGRITGRASLGMGDSTRLEGNLRFHDVEARTVLRQSLENNSIGSGRLQGRIDFSGSDVRSFNDVTARVDMTMSQAQAFQFPILSQLAPFIAPGRSNETFQSGDLRGRLSNGVFRVERLTLAGNTVNLYADGTITTAGRLNLDMIVSTNRIGVSPSLLRFLGVKLPPIGPIPLTLIVQVTDLLSNQVVHMHVSGTTRSPSVEVQPLPTLTDEAVRFFIGRTNIPVP
jgi:translocation and assembly module TamB